MPLIRRCVVSARTVPEVTCEVPEAAPLGNRPQRKPPEAEEDPMEGNGLIDDDSDVFDDDGADPAPEDPIGFGPSVAALVIVRCVWIAAAVMLLWVGRGAWRGVTAAVVVIAAAWLLGRVD